MLKVQNIIGDCCAASYIYSVARKQFDTPFVWAQIKYPHFRKLITEYDNIDFTKYEIELTTCENRFIVPRFILNGDIYVDFIHYAQDDSLMQPLKRGDRVFHYNITEYAKQKYDDRIKRMDPNVPPTFVLYKALSDQDYEKHIEDFISLDTKYKKIVITNCKEFINRSTANCRIMYSKFHNMKYAVIDVIGKI